MFRHMRKKQAGQALVEFVLVLPLVLLLIFGILQLLEIAIAQSILSSAAAEAARSAAVHNDLTYVNTVKDGFDFGLQTREQAVETIVNVRARNVLPILAQTKATLTLQGHDEVVQLEADVPVLPLFPAPKITLHAEGRAERADWVDANPLSEYLKQGCNLGAEVVPARPVIGVDTLSINIHSSQQQEDLSTKDISSNADVHWHMGGSESETTCSGSGSYSCGGPTAAAPGNTAAYAEVDLTASECNSGNPFRLRLPFYPHQP